MIYARAATLLLSSLGLGLAAIPSVSFADAAPVYAENPSDALARNVRTLADHPKDFDALIAAGRASLKMGDTQAAAGFFGRAQEANGNSPLPFIGMGAALVATGDPEGALNYFAQAQRLGASVASFGADRGLAYDLLGKQVVAQTDYRAALNGPDRDEARRRLSLSLAISGKKTMALSTLEPLLQRRDIGAQRVRALILAVDGDISGAEAALENTMPGASARMDPFFRRLPALSAMQKAAAVHLGIFPEDGASLASTASPTVDRLASIDEFLSRPDAQSPQPQAPAATYAYTPTPAPAVARSQPPRVQVASVPRTSVTRSSPNNDLIQTQRVASDPGGRKIWLQLATVTSSDELPQEFRRIRARKPALFTGLGGWAAESGSRSRLLIGPFHSQEDARMFADALASARIDAFSWTSQPGQVVRKLPNQ